MRALYYTAVDSPLGTLWLAATDRGLCRLHIGGDEAGWIKLIAQEMGAAPVRDDTALAEARRQLGEYFAGSRHSFDLPLDARGSLFDRKVWEACSHIPYGQVRAYADLARAIGAARAARAVGSALGRNPLPIIVPCHRVLRTDGSLGGYAAGLEAKRTLLSIEGYEQR